MRDPCASFRGDAILRRPAVDPGVPQPARDLLTAPGTLLIPAAQRRPWRRDYLPSDPDRRGTTIEGAVLGATAAGCIAVFGTTPLAIGMLVMQGAASWESVSSRFALLLAEVLLAVTMAVFVTRVARFGSLRGRAAADEAARDYHGKYLTSADFDARSRRLLRRVQDAVDAVAASRAGHAGLLDEAAAHAVLADQEWDIALTLREQARLRARRAELAEGVPGPLTAARLDGQYRAAQLAEDSVVARIAALEQYAAEVRAADAAYRDWRQDRALAELGRQHVDLLARTAADEHAIAEIEILAEQARAVRRALHNRPGDHPGSTRC